MVDTSSGSSAMDMIWLRKRSQTNWSSYIGAPP
jgi:hypothetical protein